MTNRREFLKSLASVTAGVCFIGCGTERAPSEQDVGNRLSGGTGNRRETMVGGRRVRTVDVHAHCYSLEVWELVKDRNESELMRNILNRQGQDFDLNSIGHRLSQMDALGIDVQALSVGPELHYWAEEALARRIVQLENEKIAAVCSARPDRFVGIGGLSLQHVKLAIGQVEYGVRKLDLRGFMIGGSVNEDELSAPKFDPVWAKVEELGSVIFVHPRGFPDGERRSNDTHQSTTDPDARLYKKSQGSEAKLSYLGHGLMENRNGLLVRTMVTQADGTAERDAALLMAWKTTAKLPGSRRVTLGADKNYDTRDFVSTVREMQITPHVAQNNTHRSSAIDGRTTRHAGYALSQQKRKRVEQSFGWMKMIGLLRKVKLRGLRKVGWWFTFVGAAYNLIRLRRLREEAAA